MQKVICSLSFIISTIATCFGQTNDTIYKAYYAVQNEEIKYTSLIKVENPGVQDYQGSYHFGESEGESQLEVLYSNGKLFAREEYSTWENDTWKLVSVRETPSYKNGILYIDKFPYQLYLYGTEKGITSFFNEREEDKNYRYLQFNPNEYLEKPLGKYPETSFVKLTREDLQSYTKSELQIMRNEIFARYGYRFKRGGKMEAYFSQKSWYTQLEKTNNPKVDDIEQHNIDLIVALEK